MNRANCSFSKLSIITLASVMLFALAVPGRGQEAEETRPSITVGDVQVTGLVDDWSYHHHVFSNPGTEEEAIRNERYEGWLKVVNEPRYIMQQLKRRARVEGPAAEDVSRIEEAARAAEASASDEHYVLHGRPIPWRPRPRPGPPKSQIHRDWSMDMGTGATVGADNYPAKFSFNIGNANCASASPPDFVAFNTGLAGSGGSTGSGSSGQASIIAFDNLYSGCSGTVPSVYWAYNTGGTISTSVVLAWTGSQLAFIHTASSGAASLVILKWKSGEGSGAGSGSAAAVPSIPATQTTSGSAYATCRSGSTSCQLTLAFGNGSNDTNSSPFYDYAHDIVYVGDNSGYLHQFTGVFNGTPAENTTSPWPVAVSSFALNSPVYDSGTSQKVFVTDQTSSGGYVYSVNSSGSVTKSAQMDNEGFTDGPLVDSTYEQVYVFIRQTGQGAGGGKHNAVAALPTGFTSGANDAELTAFGGSASNNVSQYIGTFDNEFFTNATSPGTGNLYACLGPGNGSQGGFVQIPITTGTMVNNGGTAITVESPTATCSPASEILSVDATTTLNGTINSSATSVVLTSATGFSNHDFIQIGSEIMQITGISSNTLTVIRAQFGTTAASHSSGATVQDVHDRIFLGTTANGSVSGVTCTGACVYSFDLTVGSGSSESSETLPSGGTAGLAATGGSSGLIIDNAVPSGTQAGASQVYFSPLSNQSCAGNSTPTGNGTGGCAVQASQKALM